ncbi:SDR family oxidoreductase [Phycicoccus jejuensis]|uniref:SDR family NAD(P)-dependent oxidoreductase n=1 Tax=Phycicoccus jejuensis TaxID=367299 RepID=UPI003850191F
MSTALVTGASAGIGRAFAERLAHDGLDVVLVARDRARLERLAAELRERYGVATEVLVADLADRAQTQEVCRRLADEDRPVEVLVNNAGLGQQHPFLDNEIRREEAALDVMVRAVLLTCHAAGRAMRARGSGRIVNVSSVASFTTSGPYSAAKSYVTVLSEALAGQLAGTGVAVTVVCPGLTRSEFHERARMSLPGVPRGLWLDADEVARQGLADAAAGRVVSVPGPQWKTLSLAVRMAPRPLVRGAGTRLVERLRGRR